MTYNSWIMWQTEKKIINYQLLPSIDPRKVVVQPIDLDNYMILTISLL